MRLSGGQCWPLATHAYLSAGAGMTFYYVRLWREIPKAYLFLAATEREAEKYADRLRDEDPEAVVRELVFWRTRRSGSMRACTRHRVSLGSCDLSASTAHSRGSPSLRSDRTRYYAPIVMTRTATMARTSWKVGRTLPAITGIRAK